jgi:hypothetical protein
LSRNIQLPETTSDTLLKIDMKFQGDVLFVTANGRTDFDTASRLLKEVCEAAAEKHAAKILVDCLAVTGQLAPFERYRLGAETADVYLTHRMDVKLAFVGVPPTTQGFGVRVAQNRGINTKLFSTTQEARQWLDEAPDVAADSPGPAG